MALIPLVEKLVGDSVKPRKLDRIKREGEDEIKHTDLRGSDQVVLCPRAERDFIAVRDVRYNEVQEYI